MESEGGATEWPKRLSPLRYQGGVVCLCLPQNEKALQASELMHLLKGFVKFRGF